MEYIHLGRSGLGDWPNEGKLSGPRTLGQLDDAQRAVTLQLGDDVLKRLADLFPGYRPAPEHYAW